MNQVSDIIKSELLNLDKILGSMSQKTFLLVLWGWPLFSQEMAFALRMGLLRPLNQQPNLSYLGLKHQAQAQILGIKIFKWCSKSKQRFKSLVHLVWLLLKVSDSALNLNLTWKEKKFTYVTVIYLCLSFKYGQISRKLRATIRMLVTHGTKWCPQTQHCLPVCNFQQFGSVMRKKKRVYSLITPFSGHPSNYPPPPMASPGRGPGILLHFHSPFFLQEPAHWL